MAKPKFIELSAANLIIPILYEDRSVMVIDKPPGWLLAPNSWDRTARNLQLAIESSINAREFWARSRSLRYLRFAHRLDAETTGALLLVKSDGAMRSYSELFENRNVEKVYWAVVHGAPKHQKWVCDLRLSPYGNTPGLMRVDPRTDKEAETHFRVLQVGKTTTLVEARPRTGRTHQIRVHLAESGHPVVGDLLYGPQSPIAAATSGDGLKAGSSYAYQDRPKLALRAVELAYMDPFQRRPVRVKAPTDSFLRDFGFEPIAPAAQQKIPPPQEQGGGIKETPAD